MKSFTVSYVIEVNGNTFSGTSTEWAVSASNAEEMCRQFLERSYGSSRTFEIIQLGVA